MGFVIKIFLEFSVVEHFCKAFPISDCWLARVTEVAGAARQEMIMCSPARFHSPLKLFISCFVNGEWLNASQKNRTWKVWYSSFVCKYFYMHLDWCFIAILPVMFELGLGSSSHKSPFTTSENLSLCPVSYRILLLAEVIVKLKDVKTPFLKICFSCNFWSPFVFCSTKPAG